LIAPLDWGLGHAARCVPIIRCLIEKGAEPVIAADARPLAFLKNEFPELEFVRLPGYDIAYPAKGSMAMKMLASVPRILRGIRAEHHLLGNIIRDHKIDAVISDNRFGLWTKKVPCVFITHQLMIKSPMGESILHRLNKSYIAKYTECWIPDHSGENNLSGDLSHKYKLPANAHFIGTLSRFENLRAASSPKKRTERLVLLSGPEPQRSIFEKMISDQLHKASLSAIIIQGKPESNEKREEGNIAFIPHAGTAELFDYINSAELIISRPGYSTVMDLSTFGKKAVFVPTPGQTEQEYLAELMMKKGIGYSVTQDKFDLRKAIDENGKYNGFKKTESANAYKERMDLLLKML
jgi:predicted glycosyltransferase